MRTYPSAVAMLGLLVGYVIGVLEIATGLLSLAETVAAVL
jgi:hypothetical protein